jgi:hypothetical protein
MKNNTIKKAIELAQDLDEGMSNDGLTDIKFVDVNTDEYDDMLIPDEAYNAYNLTNSNQLKSGNFLFVISVGVMYCFIDKVTKDEVMDYLAKSN